MLYTKISKCRICETDKLTSFLDLGQQALTGVFPKDAKTDVAVGPLELVKCEKCHLVQLGHNYQVTELYGENYGYRSGLNASMVRHLKGRVSKLLQKVEVGSGDLVIDIGANDSTLLQNYLGKGARLVGIDPSGPKFKKYYPKEIELIPTFFSAAAVKQHLGDVKAKAISSIAMFYDLENPVQFMREIHEVLAEDGVWLFEQSYMPFMLDTCSYDTACHEHLEYYGLHQIKFMTDLVGFKIVDLEFNDVNGGSFAITVAKKNSKIPEATAIVEKTLADEVAKGYLTLKPFEDFRRRTEEHRTQLRDFLGSIRNSKKKVFGYGASTKGNVLLQYCGIGVNDLPYIAEVNEDKFGAYTPGTKIPIISEAEALKMKPDYFMVLPWHFRAGILEKDRKFIDNGGHFIFPLPKIETV